MALQNILVVSGGDGSEHEISLISSKYVIEQLKKNPEFAVSSCVLTQGRFVMEDGSVANFGNFAEGNNLEISYADGRKLQQRISCVVPCLHGFPGETGDFQAFLELYHIPYIGCRKEASLNCFNKVTTKFYLSAFHIENTPSIFLADSSEASLKRAHEAFVGFGSDVYVKAASQGSSIGCYHVQAEAQLDSAIQEAFTLSNTVLLEKTIEHRELEVAAYEYRGELHITEPGEIIIPEDVFYTFDEKYSSSSNSVTTVEVEGLNDMQRSMIKSMATRAFKGLNLRHLSRIDFFLGRDGTLYINEINTFPGMTPISMFPKLVEHNGLAMSEFLKDCVLDAISNP